MSTSERYVANHVERRLAEDERTAELGIRVRLREGRLYLTGEVASAARRETVQRVAQELVPECEVVNEITVEGPEGLEADEEVFR